MCRREEHEYFLPIKWRAGGFFSGFFAGDPVTRPGRGRRNGSNGSFDHDPQGQAASGSATRPGLKRYEASTSLPRNKLL